MSSPAPSESQPGDQAQAGSTPVMPPFERYIRDNPLVAILLMMGMAILFCLCSEADAFVAANFQLFWPPASKLAFLVLGPMLDLKLYMMYTRVFRTRLIFTIFLSVTVQVFIYCALVNYIVGNGL